MITYTISSILWALGGLVVGFYLGRSGQSSTTVNRTGGIAVATDQSETVTVEATVQRFRDTLTFDRIVGWVIVVLAVVSVITVSYSVNRQQQSIECQANYNARFVVALNERSDAASADRQAQKDLLTGMFTARDETTRRALVEAYLQKLNDADNKRDDNPLPQRPIC